MVDHSVTFIWGLEQTGKRYVWMGQLSERVPQTVFVVGFYAFQCWMKTVMDDETYLFSFVRLL